MAKKNSSGNPSGGKSPKKKTAKSIVKAAEKAKAEAAGGPAPKKNNSVEKMQRARRVLENANLNNFLQDYGDGDLDSPDHPLRQLEDDSPDLLEDLLKSYSLNAEQAKSLGFKVQDAEDPDTGSTAGWKIVTEEPAETEDISSDLERFDQGADYNPEDYEPGYVDQSVLRKTLGKSGLDTAESVDREEARRAAEGDLAAKQGSNRLPIPDADVKMFQEMRDSLRQRRAPRPDPRERVNSLRRTRITRGTVQAPRGEALKEAARKLARFVSTDVTVGDTTYNTAPLVGDDRPLQGNLSNTTEYVDRGIAPISRTARYMKMYNRERRNVGEFIDRMEGERARLNPGSDAAGITVPDPLDTVEVDSENLEIQENQPTVPVRSSGSAGKVIRPDESRFSVRRTPTTTQVPRQKSVFELPPGETLHPNTVEFLKRSGLSGLTGGTLVGGTTVKTAGAKVIRTGAQRVGRPQGDIFRTASGDKISSVNGKVFITDKDTGEVRENTALSVRPAAGQSTEGLDIQDYELENPLKETPMDPMDPKYIPEDYAGIPYDDPDTIAAIKQHQATMLERGNLPFTTGQVPSRRTSNSPFQRLVTGTGEGEGNPAVFIDTSQPRAKSVSGTASGYSKDMEALAKHFELTPEEMTTVFNQIHGSIKEIQKFQEEAPGGVNPYGEQQNIFRAKRGGGAVSDDVTMEIMQVPKASGATRIDPKTGERVRATIGVAVQKFTDKQLGTGEIDPETGRATEAQESGGRGIIDRLQNARIAKGKAPLELGSDEYIDLVKKLTTGTTRKMTAEERKKPRVPRSRPLTKKQLADREKAKVKSQANRAAIEERIEADKPRLLEAAETADVNFEVNGKLFNSSGELIGKADPRGVNAPGTVSRAGTVSHGLPGTASRVVRSSDLPGIDTLGLPPAGTRTVVPKSGKNKGVPRVEPDITKGKTKGFVDRYLAAYSRSPRAKVEAETRARREAMELESNNLEDIVNGLIPRTVMAPLPEGWDDMTDEQKKATGYEPGRTMVATPTRDANGNRLVSPRERLGASLIAVNRSPMLNRLHSVGERVPTVLEDESPRNKRINDYVERNELDWIGPNQYDPQSAFGGKTSNYRYETYGEVMDRYHRLGPENFVSPKGERFTAKGESLGFPRATKYIMGADILKIDEDRETIGTPVNLGPQFKTR